MREFDVVWLDVWSGVDGWEVNDWRVIGRITCDTSSDDWSVVCKNIVTSLIDNGFLESYYDGDIEIYIEWREGGFEIYGAAEMQPLLNLQEVA